MHFRLGGNHYFEFFPFLCFSLSSFSSQFSFPFIYFSLCPFHFAMILLLSQFFFRFLLVLLLFFIFLSFQRHFTSSFRCLHRIRFHNSACSVIHIF